MALYCNHAVSGLLTDAVRCGHQLLRDIVLVAADGIRIVAYIGVWHRKCINSCLKSAVPACGAAATLLGMPPPSADSRCCLQCCLHPGCPRLLDGGSVRCRCDHCRWVCVGMGWAGQSSRILTSFSQQARVDRRCLWWCRWPCVAASDGDAPWPLG